MSAPSPEWQQLYDAAADSLRGGHHPGPCVNYGGQDPAEPMSVALGIALLVCWVGGVLAFLSVGSLPADYKFVRGRAATLGNDAQDAAPSLGELSLSADNRAAPHPSVPDGPSDG